MIRFLLSIFQNIFEKMLQLLVSKKHVIHNLLSIYIKTTSGNTLCIDIDPKCDISHIKKIVAPQIGLQPDEVKVIFAGKELGDDIIIEECDLGQQSILHIVKIKASTKNTQGIALDPKTSTPRGSKSNLLPLCETLDDSMFSTSSNSRNNSVSLDTQESSIEASKELEDFEIVNLEKPKVKRIHFFVYCATCKELKQGKLRVRCNFCKSGAFTVHSDPQSWAHVLQAKQITGTCENEPEFCEELLQNKEPTFAEFYFKCSEHPSLGETDQAVPLDLIRPNLKQISCIACLEIPETIFTFPCQNDHVTCLDCFRQYCMSRLTERQFWQHPEFGYTLACPSGCADSFIKEIHHFRLLDNDNYDRYQRFATEEYVLQSGGLLCPQPGCGMGILADADCTRITCQHCKFVFCRNCLQGYHIGECEPPELQGDSTSGVCDEVSCEPKNNGEEASRTTIKVITKPCPRCRTPTERDGGCMHMVCTRSGCQFHWCWVCQTEWTRECMGDHWFG
ncbi:E3 ubiquitin-protein ligase parkin [Anthonomus grandis grandis]|uniref:E3 ubiquitin-protein ligase parkin n=1 Tax=Anthonomus grandis grandis TaxID=2921223 RepID=UPI00216622BD|nr:E3 ubiquitin-protein ligase parkin [Anthonomus grandis grandis]